MSWRIPAMINQLASDDRSSLPKGSENLSRRCQTKPLLSESLAVKSNIFLHQSMQNVNETHHILQKECKCV
jgi:hypothetical protein